MKKKDGYIFFPLILLKDAINNINASIDNIINYCFYCNTQIYHKYENEVRHSLDIDINKFNLCLEKGKFIYESIPDTTVKVSIRKEVIWNYYNTDKTEYEIVLLIAFSALKSIIQRQTYKKITNKYLLSRMSFCNKTTNQIEDYLIKYNTRYYLDKIKKDLELHWHLKIYGENMRGFYVSFELNRKDLIKKTIQNSARYKIWMLKKEKSQSKIKALEEINKQDFINLSENTQQIFNIYK